MRRGCFGLCNFEGGSLSPRGYALPELLQSRCCSIGFQVYDVAFFVCWDGTSLAPLVKQSEEFVKRLQSRSEGVVVISSLLCVCCRFWKILVPPFVL